MKGGGDFHIERDGITFTRTQGALKLHLNNRILDISHRGNITVLTVKDATPSRIYWIYENQLYQVVSESADSPDGSLYTFLKRPFIEELGMEEEMFLMHNNNLYRVDRIEECSGDASCKHCSACEICRNLHCKEH